MLTFLFCFEIRANTSVEGDRTGLTVLKLGKRLRGEEPLSLNGRKCLRSRCGCRARPGTGREARRGLAWAVVPGRERERRQGFRLTFGHVYMRRATRFTVVSQLKHANYRVRRGH